MTIFFGAVISRALFETFFSFFFFFFLLFGWMCDRHRVTIMIDKFLLNPPFGEKGCFL